VTSTLDRVGNEELDLPGPVQQSKASNYTSIKSAVLDNGQAYVEQKKPRPNVHMIPVAVRRPLHITEPKSPCIGL